MITRVGIYGSNGHQITNLLEKHKNAELVAVAGYGSRSLPEHIMENKNVKHYSTLKEMLEDKRVEMVSLCSPRRRDQAAEAICCLKAGKHVYAEKPCAMSEDDLNSIVETSKVTGLKFHEMAGTAFEQPYVSMREVIKAGTIGEVVQVLVQKSYPYFKERPQDNDVDGGLVMQVGIHAMRFIEHVAGQKIVAVQAIGTKLGSVLHEGNLQMAASYIIRLENGGVGSIIANYLNPKGFISWGNEHLRIFGTKGFIEAVDGGIKTRLVVGEKDYGPIEFTTPARDYFDFFIDEVQGKGKMPITLENELHPTRMVIRANETTKDKLL